MKKIHDTKLQRYPGRKWIIYLIVIVILFFGQIGAAVALATMLNEPYFWFLLTAPIITGLSGLYRLWNWIAFGYQIKNDFFHRQAMIFEIEENVKTLMLNKQVYIKGKFGIGKTRRAGLISQYLAFSRGVVPLYFNSWWNLSENVSNLLKSDVSIGWNGTGATVPANSAFGMLVLSPIVILEYLLKIPLYIFKIFWLFDFSFFSNLSVTIIDDPDRAENFDYARSYANQLKVKRRLLIFLTSDANFAFDKVALKEIVMSNPAPFLNMRYYEYILKNPNLPFKDFETKFAKFELNNDFMPHLYNIWLLYDATKNEEKNHLAWMKLMELLVIKKYTNYNIESDYKALLPSEVPPFYKLKNFEVKFLAQFLSTDENHKKDVQIMNNLTDLKYFIENQNVLQEDCFKYYWELNDAKHIGWVFESLVNLFFNISKTSQITEAYFLSNDINETYESDIITFKHSNLKIFSPINKCRRRNDFWFNFNFYFPRTKWIGSKMWKIVNSLLSMKTYYEIKDNPKYNDFFSRKRIKNIEWKLKIYIEKAKNKHGDLVVEAILNRKVKPFLANYDQIMSRVTGAKKH